MNTLRAGALVLEPLASAHAPEMFALLQDPAIYAFENAPPPSAAALAERYRRLESRSSPDGSEQWLNWAIRLHERDLVGFLQATVLPGHKAHVAYVLNSRWWRRGIASAAVQAMLMELAGKYAVVEAYAVLKAANFRSLGLLAKLGFTLLGTGAAAPWQQATDEITLRKALRPGQAADCGARQPPPHALDR